MSTIVLEVEEDTARAFKSASEDEKRKYQILLALRLRELTSKSARSLQKTMDEIGAMAEARGLTPEVLDQLLEVE